MRKLPLAMKTFNWSLLAIAGLALFCPPNARALPPPEEIPEEVLRTKIILEARSPLTGEPLTAAEYAQLQAELQRNPNPLVSQELQELIYLLQLRRVLRPVIPFLP